MRFQPGTRLGRYEIRAHLGAGGMGEVYLARDPKLDRDVALKLLPADVVDVPDRMRRFVQEARAASSLNHPNILTIHEIDETASGHFIATEFVDGETLRERMRGGGMSIDEATDVGCQVASALTAAHAAGIVHRDIKPENIMRRRDGLVKVVDFGLAKLADPAASMREADTGTALATMADAGATSPGVVLGTLRYMSPEQARGRPVDARTDIFSLGLVLYEMLTGHLPFEGANALEAAAALLGDKPPAPISRSVPDVPPELERIVLKAVRREPDERYQTAKDLLSDLKNLGRAHASPSSAATATAAAVLPTGGLRRWRAAAIAILLVALTAVAGWLAFRGSRGTAIDSIAVLPFENRTKDPNVDYLSDGITEALIDSLSQLPNVRVIARSSVFNFKGRTGDIQQIARQLGVRAILTGRVLMQGDTLDIRAELTDSETHTSLWGNHYTRNLSDLLTMQDDIARQVIDALRVRLTGGQQDQVTKRFAGNADAYRVYLEGRYRFNSATESDMPRAIESFGRAIALDPGFALAYAARGEATFTMGDLSLPMQEAAAKGKADALKALALDPDLVEGLSLLANIKFQYDWDLSGAEHDFRRVLALNPNYAEAHHQYTYLLAMTGRTTEAIRESELAMRLDPVSPPIVVDSGLPYYLARRYDEAIVRARKGIELFPDFFFSHILLGSSLIEKGDFAEGIAELEKAKSLGPSPLVLGQLGYAYARGGRTADARAVLAELQNESRSRYVAAYWLALIQAALNRKDEAFASLERAYAARSWWLMWLKTDPKIDSLRSDPRFGDLARRVGFAQ
jgi:TolB-like protein/tetratricopeptide (TPR) repeat protein